MCIYAKLLEARKKLFYLKKDGENKFQNYSYLTESKIKAHIKKVFDELGILFLFSLQTIRELEVAATSKGTKQFLTTVSGTYCFLDSEKPESKYEGSFFGTGVDSGDKGLYKAITGGVKYILNTTFLIPTGDDPEIVNELEKDEAENNNRAGKKPISQPTLSREQKFAEIEKTLGAVGFGFLEEFCKFKKFIKEGQALQDLSDEHLNLIYNKPAADLKKAINTFVDSKMAKAGV